MYPPLTILNDLHLGANRSAGTTINTKLELRIKLLDQFGGLLPTDSDLMILGDLFDTFDINTIDFYRTYTILAHWLSKTGRKLTMVAGNHDLSKTSSTVSHFELLCAFLRDAYPLQVQVILKPVMTPYGYVIPHLPNQALFDEALAAVPECDYLFLHTNYDNNFAVQSDQSLNLTKEQADACPARNIIMGHEHNMKKAGKVLLPGNQIASSISDWISSPTKYYAKITSAGVQLVPYMERTEEYEEIDWRLIETATSRFIRVVGKVKPEEATLAVTAIAKFRGTSPALVISSAVEIEAEDGREFSANLESAQAFDVMKALKAFLTDAEMTKVQGLLC